MMMTCTNVAFIVNWSASEKELRLSSMHSSYEAVHLGVLNMYVYIYKMKSLNFVNKFGEWVVHAAS